MESTVRRSAGRPRLAMEESRLRSEPRRRRAGTTRGLLLDLSPRRPSSALLRTHLLRRGPRVAHGPGAQHASTRTAPWAPRTPPARSPGTGTPADAEDPTETESTRSLRRRREGTLTDGHGVPAGLRAGDDACWSPPPETPAPSAVRRLYGPGLRDGHASGPHPGLRRSAPRQDHRLRLDGRRFATRAWVWPASRDRPSDPAGP